MSSKLKRSKALLKSRRDRRRSSKAKVASGRLVRDRGRISQYDDSGSNY